ncbi:hypothetical protein [Undibacterium flavidum]|uniref:Uncharacterized protein n=1 Tax=Undibacterium flavidum TaxID=2762297 RepID=A0ABR6Y912_9BURK|nr:hypothetical protein [Undibacterium flavidum]MBC3873101.1 hypothetical protein [Undibacterium flavidum]
MQNTQSQESGHQQAMNFDNYEINIEKNPDRWRGGFVWSVSLGDDEVECGLEFSRRLAEQSANYCVSNLSNINLPNSWNRDL